MTLEEYIKSNGYEVSDLTEEELEAAAGELEIINKEGAPNFLDGVFSPQGSLWMRMIIKLAKDKCLDWENLTEEEKDKLQEEFLYDRLGLTVDDDSTNVSHIPEVDK